MSVYDQCPVLENNRFRLRLIKREDVDDLLKVYSDKNALPFFNSDNCNGDNFYYPNKERMAKAIDFWLDAYKCRGFVRFSIVDKQDGGKVIGTIELFGGKSAAALDDFGVLRLDVRSDYEKKELLTGILSIVAEPACELFFCRALLSKAPIYAVERLAALKESGFTPRVEPLLRPPRQFYDYWQLQSEKWETMQ